MPHIFGERRFWRVLEERRRDRVQVGRLEVSVAHLLCDGDDNGDEDEDEAMEMERIDLHPSWSGRGTTRSTDGMHERGKRKSLHSLLNSRKREMKKPGAQCEKDGLNKKTWPPLDPV
ncbi:hypothetical protein AAC387_Pa12g0299 [Persea americana]